MGLSAQQCRLLSITGRKSDCEFRSMALSHEKIALSREMADLSNEYQNSMDHTKLVYDYYGNGDLTTPVSYDLLMTPSVINDYSPVIITDTANRVILDSRYAAAAQYAGIPQEGLGGEASRIMRNKFLEGLYSNGKINIGQMTAYKGAPYNPKGGLGVVGRMDKFYDTVDKEGLIAALETMGAASISNTDFGGGYNLVNETGESIENTPVSLAKLLSDETNYSLYKAEEYNIDMGFGFWSSSSTPCTGKADEQVKASNEQLEKFVKWLKDSFSILFDPEDISAQMALGYAEEQLMKMFSSENYTDKATGYGKGHVWNIGNNSKYNRSKENDRNYVLSESKNNLGTVVSYTGDAEACPDDHVYVASAASLNNIADAFLSNLAYYREGVGNDYNMYAKVNTMGSANTSDWASNPQSGATFEIYWGSKYNTDDVRMAGFYDLIFNQICSKGWTQDDKITNNDHLQNTLKSGMLYINRQKDDGWFYQVNYATDKYVKEVSDDMFITKAEAKYNTEKAKLSSKEQMIDLKMKNLDTEISALTTEYDTIKSTISKNAEKVFKRYSA